MGLNDHRLEGSTTSTADSPADGDAGSPALSTPNRPHPVPVRLFPKTVHSWGINCAQTAIIPTNSTIDASAAASSTNVFNIAPLPSRTYGEQCSFFVLASSAG